MSSLRDQIQKIDDIESSTVHVAPWDVDVELRTITAKARGRMLREFSDTETGEIDVEKFYPAIIVAAAFDPETGEKLFDPGDVSWLGEKSGTAVEFLAQAAMELNGMRGDSVDEAGNASTGTQSGDSTSVSPNA